MIWRRQLFFYSEVVGLPIISKPNPVLHLLLVQQNSIFRLSKEEVSVYHFAFDIPKKRCLKPMLGWKERRLFRSYSA
jgi:catechol-2,3-dioxygenase